MREHDRHRHELFGLATGVAEHHALVARAPRVDAQGDIVRLLVDRRKHGAARRVETVCGVRVADRLDRAPGDLLDVDVASRRDLPRDDAKTRRQERFARDASPSVDSENGVEDGIRNLVCDLVRVPLGDRLGREDVLVVLRHDPGGKRSGAGPFRTAGVAWAS